MDCDNCKFRSETCLCELSKDEDDCPLALFYDYQDCVIGIDTNDKVVLSYEKMVLLLADEENIEIKDAKNFVDFNLVRLLDYTKTPIIIMYEKGE